jgi:crossover junction endodeoxyribonuclease RuvC
MRILGIDPGTATTGFGVIDVFKGKQKVIAWGLIKTDKQRLTGERLQNIYRQTLAILSQYRPDVFAMERIFFATNAKTAIAVGQAQGVMLLAAARSKLPVVEYAPGTIKKLVAGSGRATKKDVQKAVRKFLGNRVKSEKGGKTHFDNCADALAVALTHALKEGERRVVKKNG